MRMLKIYSFNNFPMQYATVLTTRGQKVQTLVNTAV